MNQPLSVVLRPPRISRETKPLPWLVRKLGLDVYGTSLLTERGKAELTALAGMLGVVALFDWLAWTFLFNAILHSRATELGLKTLIAAGLASLITAMMIFFERGFLTMDLTRQKGKVTLRLAVRILLILTAAVVTAKPVELMAFQPAIEARTHEEKVTTYAINLLLRINELEAAQTNLAPVRRSDVESCQTYASLNGRELELAKLQSQLESLRAAERSASRDLEALRAAAAGVDASEDHANQVAQAEQRLRRATGALGEKRAAVENGRIELEFLQGKHPGLKETCGRDFEVSQTDRESRLTGFAAEQGKIREHLNILRRSDPGSVEGLSVQVGNQPFTYHFTEYDVWNQLRILDDLLEGRPAHWQGGLDPKVMAQAEVLDLKPPPDCQSVSCNPAENRDWAALQAQAERYSRWSWAVFAIAVLVPCLALLIKAFAPLDMVHYYSLASQYRAGHPDAIKVAELEAEGAP